MPRIGFGVYKIPPSRCEVACLAAIRAGYRHLDCAQLYRSEAQVASAVALSGVPRRDVFLTTKIKTWRGSDGDELYKLLLDSVRRLGGAVEDAYVDLFLVHTPRFSSDGVRGEVWLALERLKREGRARAIGVSNFGVGHLEQMRSYATSWPPSVNQIEVSPYSQSMLLPPEYLPTTTTPASSLVPAERAGQVLSGSRHRPPGVQPARSRHEAQRSYTECRCDEVQSFSRAGAA